MNSPNDDYTWRPLTEAEKMRLNWDITPRRGYSHRQLQRILAAAVDGDAAVEAAILTCDAENKLRAKNLQTHV